MEITICVKTQKRDLSIMPKSLMLFGCGVRT